MLKVAVNKFPLADWIFFDACQWNGIFIYIFLLGILGIMSRNKNANGNKLDHIHAMEARSEESFQMQVHLT